MFWSLGVATGLINTYLSMEQILLAAERFRSSAVIGFYDQRVPAKFFSGPY